MTEVALVTGASRGIGAAIAELLAARDYAVAVNYASDERGALEVVDRIKSKGGRAVSVQGDVSKPADVTRLFLETEAALGAISALVNNAGITGGFSRVEDLKLATLERVLAVNVVGAVLCSQEAVRRMSTRHGGRGGGIVNVSSLAARTGSAGEWVHYATSKGALNSFSLGLAKEVALEAIRVNVVAPGFIETGINAAAGEPDRSARVGPTVPMQRVGTPEEVAGGVAWLLSPEASYVTGTILEIGGGR